MHMADALLSPAVALTMDAVSAAACVYCGKKIRQEKPDAKLIPLMGVSGAFVFAGQMINVSIPLTGASGHLGGGILLAALLGPEPALLTMTVVLFIQCLCFADGGLLALGCNVFHMGVIPCLLIYPLLVAPLLKQGNRKKRLLPVSLLGAILSLQLGSFGVVLETTLSGITALPFGQFLLLMQPIHLAIGILEGLITGGVLLFLYQERPEILALERSASEQKISLSKPALTLAILALLIGGGLSLLASAAPDGLEWSIQSITGSPELTGATTLHQQAETVQMQSAIDPDYSHTSVAGILGAVITAAVAGLLAYLIRFRQKRHDKALH